MINHKDRQALSTDYCAVQRMEVVMELRQLQYFLLVAQEHSFSKAAKKAYMSQQALSKSILSLEQELGVPLFERRPHGVTLTAYGQSLMRKAWHITNTVNEAVSELHNMKENLGRTIRLAITTGVEESFHVSTLFRFQDMYPQYQISTVASTDREIEQWLISEKIELGLLGAQGDSAKLDFLCLRESVTFLAVHRDNPLSAQTSVCLEDLRHEHFLLGSTDFYANNQLMAVCNLNGFTPDVWHQTENILYLSSLVANNQGIFLCPATSMEHFNHPSIRLIPIRDDPKIFSVHLATKKNHTLSVGADLFRTFILENHPH